MTSVLHLGDKNGKIKGILYFSQTLNYAEELNKLDKAF